MKKNMSWIGIAALVCVLLMGMSNVLKQSGGAKKMEGVEAYMESRYPGEQFTYSGAQVGGRGAYTIVSLKGEPDATFRVFANNGKNAGAFDDTYYTLTLRQEAKTEADRLVQGVFQSAYVLPKIYQLIEGEELAPYPTLKEYYAKNGANIDLRVVVDDSEAAAFTQENIEKALAALSERFVCETVVFSLAKPGKMADVKGMNFAKAESGAKDWSAKDIKARVSGAGSYQLR
ncbi:MAG: hypothetical protein IKB82_00165 [Clostridia bacterium]|nr:hypothetical protein [Clostridia bacterium]